MNPKGLVSLLLRSRDASHDISITRDAHESAPENWLQLCDYARVLARYERWKELDALASGVDFQKTFPHAWPQHLHDLDAFERRTFLEVALIACQSPASIAQLCRSVRYVVKNNIAGDFVECGVYKGASIVAMIRTLQDLGSERRIWLYDTFEGMPEPEPIDQFYAVGEHDGGLGSWEKTKRHDGSGGSDWVYAPIEEVRHHINATNYPARLLNYVKGKVEDTIPARAPLDIALLRLDTDFYRSTRHELEQLYPRLMRAGVLILDDYGAYSGAQKAADEFFQTTPFHMARIDEHVRIGVKT